MVEYRNKKEERTQHHERLKVLKKKHQPMLQLKEYEQRLIQLKTFLIPRFQRAHQPHQNLGNHKEEDERLPQGDREHST